MGLSTVKNMSDAPTTLLEGAIDFSAFLAIIFTDIFPNLAERPLYIAGESFGGHYVSGYIDYLIAQREISLPPLTTYTAKIQGIILINAYIEASKHSNAYHELLCQDPAVNVFNNTICDKMEAAIPECARLGQICEETYKKLDCEIAAKFCDEEIQDYYTHLVDAGLRSPYNCTTTRPLPSNSHSLTSGLWIVV